MMSMLPKSDLEPDDDGKKRVSISRIALWVIVGGIGLYYLGAGLVGILAK